MSLACPRCGNSIEQDFGMITCGQCHTILFIDMEGQIQIAGDESAASTTDSIAEASADASAAQESSEPVGTDQATFEPASAESYASANDGFAAAQEEPMAVRHEMNLSRQPEADSAAQFQGSLPSEMGAAGPETVAMQSESQGQQTESSSQLFSEVSDFGNNKQDFGALSYTLHIENIDTGEIRQKLAEALTDSKFQWDVNELLQKIEKGRLEIAQINPVKASILVHRLQEVPVRVSWDQKLL